MLSENVYVPVQSLNKSILVKTGGACGITFFKKESVQEWPSVDPIDGIMKTSVQLLPGESFYKIEATEKDRTFTEELKRGPEGPYLDMAVNAILAGNTVVNTLSIQTMKYSEFGLIINDRAGFNRLIGNADSCAQFSYGYTSGDINSPRRRTLKWTWQHANEAPIYGGQAFNISVGGVPVTAGSLTLIIRFRVNDAGAPMMDGDTELVNAALANKNVLILADGIGIPIDDGSGMIDWTGLITRHAEKTLASDTITFIGGVNQQEIIEIYAFD